MDQPLLFHFILRPFKKLKVERTGRVAAGQLQSMELISHQYLAGIFEDVDIADVVEHFQHVLYAPADKGNMAPISTLNDSVPVFIDEQGWR